MLEKEKDEENNSIKKKFFLSLIRVKVTYVLLVIKI